jgi:Carboxypeptidase regulatory-like domain
MSLRSDSWRSLSLRAGHYSFPAFLAGCLLTILLTLVAAPFTGAQSTGGRIRGTVSDPSGGAVVGAKVVIINDATGSARDTESGGTGEYIFLELPLGTYRIQIDQPGFKKYLHKDVTVELNAVVSVDVILQVGGSTEVVEVTGAPPVVDTTSTQLGAVVNERASTQLPLNQRDVYQLLQLQPGVQSQLGNDTFYGSDKAGVVTVNGGRGRSNNYSVNGGDGNDLFANLPAIEPSPDSIEEFRVITNSFDAEYGRNSGAVVNVVTKSGTNELHGSFYEFLRNDVLNAHPFTFFPTDKPNFKQNQFGGTLGGPIRKDKTFVFGSYEGRRVVEGVLSQPIAVPTAEELNNGDFSVIGGANGLTDFTGLLSDSSVANTFENRAGCGSALPGPQKAALDAAAAGAATPYSQIFTGLKIPTGCFDPVALSLLQYVPGAGGSGGVQVTPNKRDRGDQFQLRVDHSFNNNQKTAIYYYFDDDNTLDPFAKFQASGATTGNFPGVYATRTQQINVTHTSTIGPTAVNEFRFSYFREGQLKFDTPTKTGTIQSSCGTGAAAAFCFTGTSDTTLVDDTGAPVGTSPDFGLHSGLGSKIEGVPFIGVSGGFSIGNNFNGQLPQIGNTFQFTDNYSKIIGNHSLKFGGDVRFQRFDQLLYFDVNGDLTFTSSTTSPVGNDLGFSDAYPDYLLGLGNSFFQGSAQHELVRSTSVYLFAQDSWKIKPNVTLNYGLRWEMNTPLTDIGKKVQTFRAGQVSTIYPCTLPSSNPLFVTGSVENCDAAGVTPVGLVFPGDKGVPNALTNTYYKGFAPRLGLNWSPGWKDGPLAKLTGGPSQTSVSMGFGIFYNPIEQLVLEQFSAEPPFGGSNFISNPYLQTPYVDQSGGTFPNPFNGILNPPRGQAIDWSQFRPMTFFGQFPSDLRLQYSDQYNLTIKRQLPHDILLQVGYVGSQGHRLLASYEVNPGNPNTCNDLQNISTITGDSSIACGPFGEDTAYSLVVPSGVTLHLPYAPGGPNGQNVPCPITNAPAPCIVTGAAGGTPVTLVGLRPYSSPLCNPLTGGGCPSDGTPVFSGVFSENTVAKSNYNSLQVLLQKNFSHGLQFQASYTLSKTMDNASSFESALNPLDFNATYGLSAYDARHRLVFNYVWDLPVPKYDGFKGKVLDGWELSGIVSFQSGFPIRITSSDDVEELDSTFLFETPGEPNLTAPFHTQDIRKNNGFVFDPNLFTNATVNAGTVGNAARSTCCGPGINNWDMSFNKQTRFGERWQMEFRADVFNIWNHAQFYSVDGDVTNQGSTFGQVQKVHDPRLIQFSLKFRF